MAEAALSTGGTGTGTEHLAMATGTESRWQAYLNGIEDKDVKQNLIEARRNDIPKQVKDWFKRRVTGRLRRKIQKVLDPNNFKLRNYRALASCLIAKEDYWCWEYYQMERCSRCNEPKYVMFGDERESQLCGNCIKATLMSYNK